MENSKRQTALQWLSEQMEYPNIFNPFIEKALEMEKEQIIEAYKRGDCNGTFETINGEQYYNETFKK